jgi:hypothetical protein
MAEFADNKDALSAALEKKATIDEVKDQGILLEKVSVGRGLGGQLRGNKGSGICCLDFGGREGLGG